MLICGWYRVTRIAKKDVDAECTGKSIIAHTIII